MRSNLKIVDAPLRARLGPKPKRRRTRLEFIRDRAKVVVRKRDEDNYTAGIKRGAIYVKRMPIGKLDEEGKELTAEAVEKRIREKIVAGEFDEVLIEGYKARMASRQRRPRRHSRE